MAPSEVVCMGAAITDVLLQPVSRDIFDAQSYPLDHIRMTAGGDAHNESIIISRLGHTVSLLSMVGDDAHGLFIRNLGKHEQIYMTGVRCNPKLDTSINVRLVAKDGERTFVTNWNGSLWKTTPLDFDASKFHGAHILSFASFFNNPLVKGAPLVDLLQEVQRQGLRICADMIAPRLGEQLADIQDALRYLDFFFPNRDEAAELTKKSELADDLLACGVRNVVIKNGRFGCYVANAHERYEVPAVSGVQACDTTGAGDNFCAEFITALLEEKDLHQCAEFANETAALSVGKIGATTGVLNRSGVDKLYEQTYTR